MVMQMHAHKWSPTRSGPRTNEYIVGKSMYSDSRWSRAERYIVISTTHRQRQRHDVLSRLWTWRPEWHSSQSPASAAGGRH